MLVIAHSFIISIPALFLKKVKLSKYFETLKNEFQNLRYIKIFQFLNYLNCSLSIVLAVKCFFA